MNPVIFFLCLALIGWRLYQRWRLPTNFPPGPTSFPVIGAIHHLSDNLLTSFLNLRSKYGNVFGLRIGPTPTVVISDFHTCVKVFKDANFSARPTYLTEVMGSVMARPEDDPSPNRGVVFSSGKVWDEQRKFILKKLSEFGVGKSRLEHTVTEQVDMLVKLLRKDSAKGAVKLGQRFSVSLVNSIWNIVTGTQFDLEDPLVHSIYQGIDKFIDSHRLIGVFMVFPWLRHIISYLGGALAKMKEDVRNMMKKIVDDHLYSGSGYEKDLVDSYLNKMSQTSDNSSSFFGRKGRTNLEQNMLELFGAGANPVATTLSFCFLYLGRNPELQEKIFREIEENVGSGSAISMEDVHRLPYTNAFIHEILRITAINFIGTPHMNFKAAKIGDYDVPAGTTVFSFLWYIMNDPSYWTNPREFNPERFIDPVTGQFAKDERLIPFLVGRRQCLGMALAQTEMFLFFSNLVREFRFTECSTVPLPEPAPTMGFVMGCPDYQIKIEDR